MVKIFTKMRIATFVIFMALAPFAVKALNTPLQNKPYGGTLVWGTHTQPTIINPILTTRSVSASIMDLVFSHLVRLNSKGEMEPDLARSWEISPDGLLYTFFLRKGIKFHDGRECTAQDVEFTYTKIIDPATGSPFRPSFELVEEFRAVDTYTFRIKLKKPGPTFIYHLAREIAPKHLLEEVDLRSCAFNRHPVGTGPFRFKEWNKDNQIILEYNPDYYEGRPYVDKIIIKSYPSTRDVWIALMRSEIDFAIFLEQEDYDIVKDDPAFRTYAFSVDGYYAVFYNLDDPVVADIRVREAIAHAIDRKALIEKAAGGYGVECNGPFYPDTLGFYPQVKPLEYNPKESLQLLSEAGWQNKNAEGILEKKGQVLEIRILVDSRNEIFKRITMCIRQQLEEIGIKVKVQLYDDDKMLTSEFLAQNKPQAHLRLLFGGADPEQAVYNWSYQSPKRMDKIWLYQNHEVDRLFEAGETILDNKRRQAIYRKVHQLIYEDQPACFLYFPFYFFAVSQKLENTDSYFTMNMPTYTFKDWYMAPTRKRQFAKGGGKWK